MKKRISIFSVVLLSMLAWWGLPVGASPVVPGTSQLHIAATADATGRGVAVDGMGVVGVGVTISGTATISFQASMDQGATWVSVTCTSLTAPASSTSTATSGAYSCPVSGRTHLRTPLTGCAACTVTVNVTTSPATPWNVGFDVNGNVLVSIPCISGESICVATSPNSYLMTRSATTVSTQLVGTGGVPTTATNATTANFRLPHGPITFHGVETCTGTCTQTQTIYGTSLNDTTVATSMLLCTITLNNPTTATQQCTVTSNWSYIFVVTSGTGGTTPLASLIAQY